MKIFLNSFFRSNEKVNVNSNIKSSLNQKMPEHHQPLNYSFESNSRVPISLLDKKIIRNNAFNAIESNRVNRSSFLSLIIKDYFLSEAFIL
jgi:hypothetical protein